MGFMDELRLARQHAGYVHSLKPWEKKDLQGHDKDCTGC